MRLGTLAIRGVVGPLFIGHGTQKLFGWFGGHGLEGTAGFFEQALGLRPGNPAVPSSPWPAPPRRSAA
jgi:putative oxidoreductase